LGIAANEGNILHWWKRCMRNTMPKNLIKPKPTFAYERALVLEGKRFIAGVDEVGVGAIAGPLIAAAMMLPL
jgi:ribonuclease HII